MKTNYKKIYDIVIFFQGPPPVAPGSTQPIIGETSDPVDQNTELVEKASIAPDQNAEILEARLPKNLAAMPFVLALVMAVAVAVSTILLLLFVAPAPIPALKRCSLARSNSERKRSYDTEPSHVWCSGVLITISHGCILGTSI